MYLSIIYIQNCMLTEMHGVRLWSWHINCFHYYYINVSQQSCGAAFNVWQLYFVFLYVIICRWYKFIKEWPDHLQKFHTTRRLRRRSLRLPTRSKSAQTGHLCTTAQAGADPGIFVCRSKFPGLKVGRRSWLANMALQSSTWNKFKKEQYHSFSACVDAGYDIKESITDILRDIQQTMQ